MSNEEDIKNVMNAILDVDVNTIDENSSMDNVENWDSIGHMNLVLALEDRFEITIPDEEAGNITSFKLIKLVIKELKE